MSASAFEIKELAKFAYVSADTANKKVVPKTHYMQSWENNIFSFNFVISVVFTLQVDDVTCTELCCFSSDWTWVAFVEVDDEDDKEDAEGTLENEDGDENKLVSCTSGIL